MMEEAYPVDRAAKRRRISSGAGRPGPGTCNGQGAAVLQGDGDFIHASSDDDNGGRVLIHKSSTIAITSTSKLAAQAVAPFLSKNVPGQYAPIEGAAQAKTKDPNTKFCYRHRPDMTCRRQADELSMDQLQSELEKLSSSDQQGISHLWTLFAAAPAKQRQLMIQGILAQCCFPQLSYISSHVKELVRIDFLSALPNELGFQILCHLDTVSLCKAAQVSHTWRTLADDDVVWHRMCEQHIDRKCTQCGWGLPLLERKRLREHKRRGQMRGTAAKVNEAAPPSPLPTPTESNASSVEGPIMKYRPWKDVYKDRFKIGSNWKHGRYSMRQFKGHRNGVTCLQFDDHILATGSYDATIKIWNVETGSEIHTLTGHRLGIRCLQFDGNKLISGSLDGTLKLWDIKTGECRRTISGHEDGIIGLHFDDTILASGSKDNTIRVWNFETKSSRVFKGHTDFVNSVRIDLPSRTLFSASDDLTVRLWDLDTKQVLHTFHGHVGPVQQVLPLPHEFEFDEADIFPRADGRNDDTASTHSHSTLDETASPASSPLPTHPHSSSHTPETLTLPFATLFSSLDRPLPPRYMLTVGLDNAVRLWDVSTGKCLRTFLGHLEGVWAVAADLLRFVSGSQDKTAKIWDARTGRCEGTFTGHTGPVTCVGLSDSRMATGGEDGGVRVYGFGN